jgi:hypothetical protein
MLNSTDVSSADLLLQDSDFPDDFENMQHPDDYKLVKRPLISYIHHNRGHHNRLIVRLCWKVGDGYIPMSFVCDTGAPMGLYLSNKARSNLQRRIFEDEMGNEYVTICDLGKATVEPTPPGHAPANILGLRVLTKLCLNLRGDGTFVFANMPKAF